MRVLLAVAAMVAMPFAVGVAQGGSPSPYSDAANCGKHLLFSEKASERGSRPAPVHGGIHGVMDLPCESGGGEQSPPSGTALLGGRVYHNDASLGRPGLGGWVVTLGGDVSASAVTDQFGRFAFGSLPAGSYWVCVEVQEGWVQQAPSSSAPCPNGKGYVLSLADGEEFPWADFAMVL